MRHCVQSLVIELQSGDACAMLSYNLPTGRPPGRIVLQRERLVLTQVKSRVMPRRRASRGLLALPFTFAMAVVLCLALVAGAMGPSLSTSSQGATPSAPTEQMVEASGPAMTSGVPTVVASGQIKRVNWFTDWQTCIWGIGLPLGVALKLAVLAPYWAVIQRFFANQQAWGNRGINTYMTKVYAACGRFLHS